ncbi:Zinc metalloproteinase/disintegrin [Halotydeus destructor]|nr:Zinc metalloproteinase/disintegrin [Halotydeus destructor]
MNSLINLPTLIALIIITCTKLSNQLEDHENHFCGNKEPERHLSNTSGLQGPPDHPVRFVRIMLIADHELYSRFFAYSEKKVKENFKQLISQGNRIYSDLNVHLVLTAIEIWTDSDRVGRQGSLLAHLKAANKYQEANYWKAFEYDAAILVTGFFYPGDGQSLDIGWAEIRSICTAKATAVLMFPEKETDNTYHYDHMGTLFSHELGHVLGMGHDSADCGCKAPVCVMFPAEAETSSWSRCSEDDFEKWAIETPVTCYARPDSRTSLVPTCGNGLVEDKEQCDCTHHDEACQECCDMTTCQLTESVCLTTLPPTQTRPLMTKTNIRLVLLIVANVGLVFVIFTTAVLICYKDKAEGPKVKTDEDMELQPLVSTPGGQGLYGEARKRSPAAAAIEVV